MFMSNVLIINVYDLQMKLMHELLIRIKNSTILSKLVVNQLAVF